MGDVLHNGRLGELVSQFAKALEGGKSVIFNVVDIHDNHHYLTGRRYDPRNPGEGTVITSAEIERLMNPGESSGGDLAMAKLRDTDNDIERLGIEQTREQLQKADLILWVIDGSQPWNGDLDALQATVPPENQPFSPGCC